MDIKVYNRTKVRIIMAVMIVLFVGVQYAYASENALMSEYAYLYSNEKQKSTDEIDRGSYNYVAMSGTVNDTSANEVEYVMRGRDSYGYGSWNEVMRLQIAVGHSFVPQIDSDYYGYKATMYGYRESSKQTGCIASCALSRTNN